MNDLTRRNFLNILKTSGAFLGASALVGPIVAYFYPPRLEETPAEPVAVRDRRRRQPVLPTQVIETA